MDELLFEKFVMLGSKIASMAAPDDELRKIINDLRQGRGTEDGFRVLFKRYHPKVLRHLRSQHLLEEDARELAQEVFIKVYKDIGSLQDVDHFNGWLFRVTRNVFNSYLERTHAQKRAALTVVTKMVSEDGTEIAAIDSVPDPKKDPLNEVIDQEKVDLLRRELMKLPTQMRSCVMMRVAEEASIERIASHHGVSVNTVKSHLAQARRMLRKRLEPEFGSLDFSEEGGS